MVNPTLIATAAAGVGATVASGGTAAVVLFAAAGIGIVIVGVAAVGLAIWLSLPSEPAPISKNTIAHELAHSNAKANASSKSNGNTNAAVNSNADTNSKANASANANANANPAVNSNASTNSEANANANAIANPTVNSNAATNSNANSNANGLISLPHSEQPPSYEETVATLRKRALEEYGIDCVNHINVCIAGSAGVGKSTLINAFRGLRNNHPLAARSSAVQETTVSIQRYDCPVDANEAPDSVARCLKLWDVPGSGTDQFPWANHFENLRLYVFDYIVILCSDRVTEADMELASKAYYHEVPFAFVRSRADQAIESYMNDTGEEDAETAVNEVKRKFREVCTEKMQSRKLSLPRTYLISAYAMLGVGGKDRKIDEDALRNDIGRSVKARRNRTTEESTSD